MFDKRLVLAALSCWRHPPMPKRCPCCGRPGRGRRARPVRISVERLRADGAAFAQALEAELSGRVSTPALFSVVAPESGAPVDALVTDGPHVGRRGRDRKAQTLHRNMIPPTKEMPEGSRRRHPLPPPYRDHDDQRPAVAIGDGSIRYTRRSARAINRLVRIVARQGRSKIIAATQESQVRAVRADLAPRDYTIDVRVEESVKDWQSPRKPRSRPRSG